MQASEEPPEEIIEPSLEICDPHHHLMDHPDYFYTVDDLLHDASGGHRVTSTVLVENGAGCFYRDTGPEHLRSVGETEVARAAQLATRNAATHVAQGIVAYAELTLGDRVAELLDAHAEASGGTLRGIRQNATRDPSPALHTGYPGPGPELYEHSDYRIGIAELIRRGLSLDSYQYFHQLPALADLARGFPDLPIVVDHVGGVIGTGPYADRRDEVFAEWRRNVEALAVLPNVWMKIGGLGMPFSGFGFETGPLRPGSADLAAAWSPYVNVCLDAFGARRCMFESNFPVDRHSCSYRALWNAFKRMTASCTRDEREWLFRRTAIEFYRIDG